METLSPLNVPGWDDSLSDHPEATVFHSAGWARVLVDTYDFQPRYLVQRSGSRIANLLPLMKAGVLWQRRKLVSLPFTDSCPPLLSPRPSAALPKPLGNELRWNGSLEEVALSNPLLAAALRLAESERCATLELRDCDVWAKSILPSVVFHGHSIPLEPTEESQLERCSPTMRRGLRKASKGPLRLKHGSELADVSAYYELHCATRRRHGLPPQSFDFFRNIHRHLLAAGRGFVTLAYVDDLPVAGAVFLGFGRHALYKFGASVESHLELRPNNFVLWHGIRRCAELGFYDLDLGRTSLDNEGLRRFKLGLGGEERLIQYVRQDMRSGCVVVTPDRAQGWHNRIFRFLPSSASRLVGKVLYRFAA